MAADSRFVKGTITTDGLGAGQADTVITGYRVKRVRVNPIDVAAGTCTITDNGGVGTNINSAAAATQSRTITPTAASPVSPLRVAVTGGGASKQLRYEIELVKPATSGLITPYGHWKAHDFTDAHGTVLTAWPDSSGNGRAMTKGGTPNITLDRTTHEWPSVKFTRGGDSSNMSVTVSASSAWTYFVVWRQEESISSLFPRAASFGAGMLETFTDGTVSYAAGWYQFAASTQTYSGVNMQTGFHVTAIRAVSNALADLYADGLRVFTNLDPQDFGASTNFTLGRGGPNEGLQGYIAEVVLFRETLAHDETVNWMRNLCNKYKVTFLG